MGDARENCLPKLYLLREITAFLFSDSV